MMWRCTNIIALTIVLAAVHYASAQTYVIDDSVGVSRRFDGIGGLSAGASSRLLYDYEEPHRSNILDILFSPDFAMNAHILKVEIGGDGQSTDGVEASHMHTADDESYERGYEWWLMKEAKRRNPNIVTYALSWAFPGWVAEGGAMPFTNSTVTYTINWLLAAKRVHGVDVDYVGVWNERQYDRNYVLSLYKAIKQHKLKTRLVVADDWGWSICDDMAKDMELREAITVAGSHYPRASSTKTCVDLGTPLWASEDFSSNYQNGECWARTLNQNFARGNLTGTVSWALIASWYEDLPFGGDGLFLAAQPWSGYYDVGSSVWATAHTTQFTTPGWTYLKHGHGSGLLAGGGSYVSLTNGKDLTIVIEVISYINSICIYDAKIPYNVSTQMITLQLAGSFKTIQQLNIFYTLFTDPSQWFIYNGTVNVVGGAVSLTVRPDMMYTLSTLNGTKGSYTVPAKAAFPLPYADNFDAYAVDSEAAYFSDQGGSFQIAHVSGTHAGVMRQWVTTPPVSWVTEMPTAISIFGDHSFGTVTVNVSVFIETTGFAFVASGLRSSGVNQLNSAVIMLVLDQTNSRWMLCNDTTLWPLAVGKMTFEPKHWYQLSLAVYADHVEGFIDGMRVVRSTALNASSSVGWAAIGSSYTFVQFDDFSIRNNQQEEYQLKHRKYEMAQA